jgi:hypothetical protein
MPYDTCAPDGSIGSVHVPADGLMGSLTMHVYVDGLKMLGARIWLGQQILKLAALVMGCGLRVEIEK